MRAFWKRRRLESQRVFVSEAAYLMQLEIVGILSIDAGNTREWLHKVRPYWGHDYHFHVRIRCPPGQANCKPQDPVPAGDGCGKELDWWFKDAVLHPKPSPVPEKPKPPVKLADLPPACRQVLLAP